MNYRRILLLTCLLFMLALPAGSRAATPAPDAEPDSMSRSMERIDQVTVTARRTPNRVTSGVAVQTISGETLSKLGVQNMADAVRRFAGANVKDYGGVGGLKTVSVRNMGASHTGVSYDGAPVSNCQGGQIDIGRFSLDNVSMLSLAIGQDENLLQPAKLYASAAVLNIMTNTPHFRDGHNSAFRFQVKGGSFGYVSPTLRWWQRIGDNVRTSLDGTFLRADGNYPFTLVNGKYVTKERRNNSAIDSWHGEANLYYTLPDRSELQLKGYYFYSKRGLPGSVTLYNPVSTETLWDKNGFVQLKYKKSFSPRWELQAIGKYNYSWNKDQELGPEFAGGIYRDYHTQQEYYLSATGLYRPSSYLTFALAQDGVINTLNSTIYECPYPRRYTSLTAFTARWQKGVVRATGSLVNTYITERVKFGDRPKDVSRLSPSLSVNVQPWSREMLFIRAMYKNTFRTPTFNDLYYDRLGSRVLRPEKANEYDLGVTWSKALFPWMDYFSVTVDGYYNTVTDKLVAFPTTYAWKMANYGKVRITGLDVTLATSVSFPHDINLTLSAAYTLQRAIDVTDPTSKSYKHQLPYTPRHSGNVGATVETPWVTVGYSIVGVGERYCLSQNIPVNRIDGYAEHTLTLSRELSFRNFGLTLRGELINITDKHYEVIKYYPMPGRSWRLTAAVSF